MEMRAISAGYGLQRGSVLALAAGADAICVGGGLADEETVLGLRDAVVDAVRTGELPAERLADAAARVRALARWTRDQAGQERRAARAGQSAWRPPAAPAGPAAPRTSSPLTEPPFVAAFTPVANIAVGDETPWGVAAETARLLPGTTTATFGRERPAARRRTAETGCSPRCCAGPADRRIVAVVRDAHRHPWMAEALDALLTARPDTVVVEMGVPGSPPAGALHIATHGAARVCGRAAAEVVAGRR